MKTGVVFDQYLVIYKWSDTPTKEFIVPRHGNAKQPSASSYCREDISVYENIDSMLPEGKSNDAIYAVLTSYNPKTAGETIRDPKVISNRRYERQKQAVTENKEEKKSTEAELMIEYLKEEYIKVNFTPNEYSTVNFHPRMLNDIERFCVKKKGIFSVDTMFEVWDGLWLTNTCYANMSLIREDGTHPKAFGTSGKIERPSGGSRQN